MILQSKYVQDENGAKFAPITTPNAIRWPNGDNLNDKLKQADWNESDTSDPAYINNKPTIPAAQVNADWNANSGVAQILNKPTNVSAFTNDAGYLTQHQDISGKENKVAIEAPVNSTDATQPITTLACEVGKYYRIDVAVGILAITLPAITDNTHVQNVVIMLTTDSNPAVTFASTAPSGGSAPDVHAQDGFAIEASKTYEINALYNGSAWVLAAVEIDTTDIQPSNE